MGTITPLVNGTLADAAIVNANFTEVTNRIQNTAEMVESAKSTFISIVQTALSVYQDMNVLGTSGTIELEENSANLIIPTGNVTFGLPENLDNTKFYQILVQVKLTDTSYVSADNGRLGTTNYFDNITPTFPTTGLYDIIYEYDNTISEWFCGAIYKGSVS